MHLKIPKPQKILLSLFLVLAVWIFLINLNQNPSLDNYFLGAQNLFFPKQANDNRINESIENQVKNLDGHWGIAIKDLKTANSYYYHETDEFKSASLYKLAVMWAAFDAIKKGQIAKEEIQPQIQSMITYSDNDSAVYLAEKLGWDNISYLMDQEGLADINLTDPPQVTANSILNLLERIYRNTAVSPAYSQDMKNLLFTQQINDRIPKYLPQNTKVGHKTGELDFLRHDAGIVIGKNSHYIFVFLTETPVPEEASDQIARLSKKIFDELEKD